MSTKHGRWTGLLALLIYVLISICTMHVSRYRCSHCCKHTNYLYCDFFECFDGEHQECIYPV